MLVSPFDNLVLKTLRWFFGPRFEIEVFSDAHVLGKNNA